MDCIRHNVKLFCTKQLIDNSSKIYVNKNLDPP